MSRIAQSIALMVLLAGCSGCAPTAADKKANDAARIDLEERARKETAKGNDAITEMNKKLSRKVTPLDLNAPPTPPAVTPTPAPKA